ncbi:MAG TPA: PDZ domain-containing protein, partial [Armatimonadota bacterium]|nr:PDZ domain-containing protein [Armatimonadota bacterium]
MGGIVAAVEDGSIAAELGLRAGDEVIAIDGHPLRDLIDYRFHSSESEIEMLVRRATGEVLFEIEKDWSEDLGLHFTCPVFDGVRECNNRCVFCFVDQVAPGMRESVRIHDDDYRLSFLAGNFVTLTNLGEDDLRRIVEWRLSPLYVSVHATDPKARARLLRSPHHEAGLRNLRHLADAGIDFHCQIVLCPGINDGSVLESTVRELAALHPRVLSVGVVPVGLTAF